MSSPTETAKPTDRNDLLLIAVATAFAAVAGYVVITLAARALGQSGYEKFAIFWAAFGIVSGAANGLLNESTRAVRSVMPRTTARPVPISFRIGLGAAGIIAVTSPLWARELFTVNTLLSVVLLVTALASWSVHASLLGTTSGSARWRLFAILVSLDALGRLVIAVLAHTFGWGIPGFLVATVAGSGLWLIVAAVSPGARASLVATADVPARALTTQLLQAVAACTASAVLIMGFPVLLAATRHGRVEDAGVIVLAVTLTRAPLLVPLTTFQGALISHFVDNRARRFAALVAPAAAVTALGVVGVILAIVIGPWLLRRGFTDDYQASGALLGALTMGALAIAWLTLTGSAALAADRHRAYAAGWWMATGVSAALMLLPYSLAVRTPIALVAGPVAGIVVHLAALRSAGTEGTESAGN